MQQTKKKAIELRLAANAGSFELKQLYKNVFESPAGRIVLEDLKMVGYYDARMPLGEEGDKAQGMREVVLYILDILESEPPEDQVL